LVTNDRAAQSHHPAAQVSAATPYLFGRPHFSSALACYAAAQNPTLRETPAFSRDFVRDHRPMIGTLGSDFEAFRGIEQ